ncbi:hypothetical protein [Candidatus Hepatobacter penaei]|uniref:hypothetical protein n=1 Tax=Candidatus Hepatobacter penaei TaxID=1274402 RepID=UPI0004F2DEE5|nr:hypothetical protein [Candidatus Hepatobacter penaei]
MFRLAGALFLSIFLGILSSTHLCAAGRYQLGPVSLNTKPKELILRITEPRKGQCVIVAFMVGKKVLHKSTLASVVPVLLKALPPRQIFWSKNYLDLEVEAEEILSFTGRKNMIESLGNASLTSAEPYGKPLSSDEKGRIAQAFGKPREYDTIFGLWDIEQEYEGGGLRGDGYLSRPRVPRNMTPKGYGSHLWLYTRDQAETKVPNVLCLKLFAGTVRLTGPQGRKTDVPLRVVYESKNGKKETKGSGVMFVWARTLSCCGKNDLVGPFGSGVRDFHYAARLVKDKDDEKIANRWQGQQDKTWVFEGDPDTQTFSAQLAEKEHNQHVLTFLDIAASGMIVPPEGRDSMPAFQLLSLRGVGPWNKHNELVMSRVATLTNLTFAPCPLRLASGVRVLVGHQPPSSAQSEASTTAPKAAAKAPATGKPCEEASSAKSS